MNNKQEVLGQYFTKEEIVERLLELIFNYKKYDKDIKILEPSFGTGNFIKVLNKKGYNNIEGCEIDEELTKTPFDFFDFPIKNKYDLIIGNPPFTKYNIKESYYYKEKYIKSPCWITEYLIKEEFKKDKIKIENAFILKSLRHIKDDQSSIGFVLPISFFIKNKNRAVKDELLRYFKTIIIYQNDKKWFDRHIPCCFAIFTNIEELKNKMILLFENSEKNEEIYDINKIHEEIIPQVIFNKTNGFINNETGIPLSNYLDTKVVNIKMSYKENNVSAKNILTRTEIPENKNIKDYRIAVARVGNASVGRAGLININKDILNGMFFVFDVKNDYKENKGIKEMICKKINENQTYFKNITCRVGSKSIKKEDVYNFKIALSD
ncbi:MAG: hypothetical protein HYU63_06740 [Armatimonadetes bacterium]|nr:hypothetical protein [Armatimonadota bacterium]